jgi:glutamate/tyrosine decarboxylase-like PLP-dependent enzyme
MDDHTFSDDRSLLREAARRAAAHLEQLPNRSVAADPVGVARLARLIDTPLGDLPTPAEKVLAELDELGAPATVASNGPRFFGFVTGGVLPASLAASWLATAWDQNAFGTASSPCAVLFERIAASWVLDLLGLPERSAVAFTTGATMANFTALAAARHALMERAGWDVEARGLFGAPELRVFVGEEAHPTLHKALGLLGLGRERVTRLPVDAQGCIRADALPALDGPAIVCAQAGNVNSGGSDPFVALRRWSDAHGGWLHVDGAFGLWAAASPEKCGLVSGVELADSWATDAHKWLNVPYDSGLCIVRSPGDLVASMSFDAAYLPAEEEHPEPFHITPETSRRARGIEVWAALRALGRSGVADLIERCCRHARRFARALEAGGCEILNDVVLNQVVVSFGDEARCTRVIDAIQREGTCWCGPTRWQGRDAMRISVSSWATSDDDVKRSIESILRCADAAGPG